MTKRKPSILFILFLLSLALNAYFLFTLWQKDVVTGVVDGDSLAFSAGRRIRLLGIDAPEKGKCLADEAKNRLEELTLGKHIKLSSTITDDFGRSLALVWVGNTLINRILIEEGLARYDYINGEGQKEMEEAHKKAKGASLGIYSDRCSSRTPYNSCSIKGNIRDSEKIYHLVSCPNYNDVIVSTSFGDRWFCSEQEAKDEGFRIASGCIH